MVRWVEYTSMVQGGDVARLQVVRGGCGARECVFVLHATRGLSEARKAPRRREVRVTLRDRRDAVREGQERRKERDMEEREERERGHSQ